MSEHGIEDVLADIIEAAGRVATYTSGLTYVDFLEDLKTQDAVVRNLEIVGEAVKRIPEEIRNKVPDIPWKSVAGMRDKLIHHYFGVNFDIVWAVVQQDLPPLTEAVKSLLLGISGSGGNDGPAEAG